MKKENSGITLLALIITIIIMLILAGVTISIVGGSDGIVAKAEQAVSKTDKAAMQEDAELSIAAIKMDYYENYAANSAKYLNAKAFIVDKIQTAYTTSRGATMVADSEGNVTYTYKGVATTLSLGEDGSVILGESVPGGDVTPDEPVVPEIPEGLKVGDTVSYSPTGTYNWQSKYYASTDTYYSTEYYDEELDSSTSDYKITSWRVYSIDESTGQVELVPGSETTGTVTLHGSQGYNNGVKLLNDACSNLYGSSSKEITARSLNMEDIENALTDEALEMLHNDGYYGVQAENAFTRSKNYPVIYGQEKLGVINGVKNTTGLGMSEQTSFIERTAGGATEGKLTASTSIQPYNTENDFGILDDVRCGDIEYMEQYFQEGKVELLFPNGSDRDKWVASRSVCNYSSYCSFSIGYVADGVLSKSAGCLYESNGYNSAFAYALFPIVSLNANLLEGSSASGWTVK